MEEQYEQVGWWVPGKLQPNWNANFQANFADMSNKFNQLGISPLVNGILPNEDVGFYFSMAEFDSIQLLSVKPPSGKQVSGIPKDILASHTIVSYSIWLSSQGWLSTSPIPIFKLKGLDNPTVKIKYNKKQTFYPAGWYFTGSFSSKWYGNDEATLRDNYNKALQYRTQTFGIQDLSPLYFCQSSFYDCVQMVLAPMLSSDPNSEEFNIPDAGKIQEYVSWFNKEGFGSLKAIPFMSEDLLSEAIEIGGKTP